jgi:tetratricopeptide (TPR) repeat protein
VEFRRAQEISVNINDWSRALYWVILSQLAFADYGSAIKDMDELEKTAPNSVYTRDMVYHRARIYFNMGYFNDSLLLFTQYINSVTPDDSETADRIAAAYFWMGECLFTMGQFDEAEKFYIWVIERFPDSPKYEVSTYRLDLIKQKKIEAELLALLQWSHEESLRTSEEYQRRLRTYEHTLNTYQRRIADLSQDNDEIPAAETISLPEPSSSSDNEWQSLHERLLERARQLNRELDILITDYSDGGSL